MDFRSMLPPVYPLPRNFERFWLDPELYFSVLPRDIFRYCLEPILSWYATSEMCGERLISPTLVHSSLPTDFPDNLILLPNGCLMVIPLYRGNNDLTSSRADLQGLSCWNPMTALLEWLFDDPSGVYDYQYDVNQDGLYLINWSLKQYQLIPHFSRIRTQEQFQTVQSICPLLNDLPNLSLISDHRIQRNLSLSAGAPLSRLRGNPVKFLTLTLSGQSVTLPLEELGTRVVLMSVGFFGGYLMTITGCCITEITRINWYATLS